MATTSRRATNPPDAAPSCSPHWLPQAERALQQLLELPANWDSYGARAIRAEIVGAAADLLRKIVQPATPPPAVVPTVRGEVQLEWHTGGIDLEIEIEHPGQFHLFYENPNQGAGLEARMTSIDLPRMCEITAQLPPGP